MLITVVSKSNTRKAKTCSHAAYLILKCLTSISHCSELPCDISEGGTPMLRLKCHSQNRTSAPLMSFGRCQAYKSKKGEPRVPRAWYPPLNLLVRVLTAWSCPLHPPSSEPSPTMEKRTVPAVPSHLRGFLKTIALFSVKLSTRTLYGS